MLKKLLLLVVIFAFASSFIYAQSYNSKLHSIKMSLSTKIVGDAVVSTATHSNFDLGYKMPTPGKTGGPTPLTSTFDWPMTVTWIPTGVFSEYDLVSNSVPDIITQNTSTWSHIHAVCMSAPLGDPTSYPNRRTKYVYSTNYGTTWTFISNVPDIRSGYATITMLADGRELISNHTDPNTTGGVSFRVYVDAFEGVGSFTTLDAGDLVHEWPRIASTNSITAPNKYIVVTSKQSPDSTFWVAGTNLTSPGTFGPYTQISSNAAERYKIARGADGRIGIAYMGDVNVDPATDGCVYFIESTNGGNSFSSPLKIYNFNVSTDSLYAYKGIALTYQGNSPKVVFAVTVSDATSIFYDMPTNAIKFWCKELPGTDPNRCISIASPIIMGMNFPEVPAGTWDGFTNICQPTIGTSGSVLFCAFQTPFGLRDGESYVWHNESGADSCTYNSQWLTVSGNGGLSWKSSQRISPIDTTVNIQNYAFSSICNSNDTSATAYYANIMMFKDSIPSIFVFNTSDPPCNGQYIFTRVAVPPPVFIQNISGEVPANYSLNQNYPNPFNPTTNIRFALPKNSLVTLKVYNVTGQLIETLVNNELVAAGVKQVSFNAARLSSGIYFYTIQAGNYKETKKMMLIK